MELGPLSAYSCLSDVCKTSTDVFFKPPNQSACISLLPVRPGASLANQRHPQIASVLLKRRPRLIASFKPRRNTFHDALDH